LRIAVTISGPGDWLGGDGVVSDEFVSAAAA
jgi:hypothetical protein